MNQLRRSAAAIILLLGLSACVSITPVPAGKLTLGGGRQVTLGRQWSDVSAIMPQRAPKVRVLSIDGPLLNRLYVAQGLAPGEGLLKKAAKEKPTPVFHADMSPTEQVEFVAASIAAMGYQRVETSGLRPAKIGADDALRFDVAAQTESGMQLRGVAQVANLSGKLHLLLYLAPAEHYYEATRGEVEAIMASAV
jgi:hypothetical protein